uniref:Uncharacterized protein n=1 Tax=Cacopsylla melanoneura TaxID=428564 RepID=A0A8D9EA35_9HEMI
MVLRNKKTLCEDWDTLLRRQTSHSRLLVEFISTPEYLRPKLRNSRHNICEARVYKHIHDIIKFINLIINAFKTTEEYFTSEIDMIMRLRDSGDRTYLLG